MPSGLDKTFEFLTSTLNDAAVDVLIEGLDAPESSIRELCLRGILKRHSAKGLKVILERLHTFDDRWRAIVSERTDGISMAIRNAILTRDNEQLCKNGCDAVIRFHDFDLIPTLVTAAEDVENPFRELTGQTLLRLTEMFYEELAAPRDYQQRRDPQRMRDYLTNSLEAAVQRFNKHQSLYILEAFLMIVHRDNVTLKQILNDPRHRAYLAISDLLTHSKRSGILRLVLSFLGDTHAPTAGLIILGYRSDLKFIEYVLRKIGSQPSATITNTLKRIETITWLMNDLETLRYLDEAAQHSAAILASQSNLNRRAVYKVLEWLLQNGKTAGRRCAATLIVDFNGADANTLVVQSLSDPDPSVVAALVKQLRARAIPGAVSRLIEYLDSPHPVIQQAARESLHEFTLKRFLASYDILDDEVRVATAKMVQKVDQGYLDELAQEFETKSRTRRLRVITIIEMMKVVERFEEQVTMLLGDSDHLIRAEAARALASCDTETAREALLQVAQGDRSAIVQDAAGKSLSDLERLPPPPLPPWQQIPAPNSFI